MLRTAYQEVSDWLMLASEGFHLPTRHWRNNYSWRCR